MAKETLFALLLRSPWWMSLLAAVPLFAVVQMFLPPVAALFATTPFLGIAAFAGWRQLRAPGAADVESTLERLRAMSWEEFSAVMAEALRRDGYAVTASADAGADFAAVKNGATQLVGCRRWKVAQTGEGPLRELVALRRARAADSALYVAAGGFSANARDYATKHGVRLLEGAELAQRVARVQPALQRRPSP